MIKKTRTYLQKNPCSVEALNHMVETFIDKSLNIFLVNEYSKPILQDEDKKITKLGWTLQATHAFNNAESALASAKELVKEDLHEGYTVSGDRCDYYSVKNKGYAPTHTRIAWLIGEYAEKLLDEAAQPEEPWHKQYQKYLLDEASKYGMDEATLAKRANVYIKAVGLEREYYSNECVRHVKTKKRG